MRPIRLSLLSWLTYRVHTQEMLNHTDAEKVGSRETERDGVRQAHAHCDNTSFDEIMDRFSAITPLLRVSVFRTLCCG